MKFIIYLTIFIPTIALSQRLSPPSIVDKSLDKWTRSVVGLETRRLKLDTIANQRYLSLKEGLRISGSNIGSSVFLKYNSKRYLITARHVIYDKWMAHQLLTYNQIDQAEYIQFPFNNIYQILRPYESSDTSQAEVIRSMISLLSATKRYVFSNIEIDLAIISLDGGCIHSIFADNLERKGYFPITISDIDTSALKYGQELMCVGYPGYSFQNFKPIPDSLESYQSIVVSEPSVTFGKVAIPISKKYYFWGDVSVGPGNSGGAVISNNKLIGIVSGQATAPIEDNSGQQYQNTNARLPFTITIRASQIFPLLLEMIKKDEASPDSWCKPK